MIRPETKSPTAICAKRGRQLFKIAIASSGLGHIQRGIETWAADTARALHHAGQDVRLFQGAGEATEDWQTVLCCLKRTDTRAAKWVNRLKPFHLWRFAGNTYQVEQTTFAYHLWRHVRRSYDILHVQDPVVALVLDRLHRLGLSRPRVILAHGTEEPAIELQRYSYLQHLAPCYQSDWEILRPPRQRVFAIPNFVDTDQFRPSSRLAARRHFALPEEALIVLCVAAIKKEHKRIDALIREFSAFKKSVSTPTMLVVAGAREAETEEVIAFGSSLLGDGVRFFVGIGRTEMPILFQAADIFALASIHEMMPIAMLEALSSGLPVVCNDTPTLHWICGPAAAPTSIENQGALANQLHRYTDSTLREEASQQARLRSEEAFSASSVIQDILTMYEQVRKI